MTHPLDPLDLEAAEKSLMILLGYASHDPIAESMGSSICAHVDRIKSTFAEIRRLRSQLEAKEVQSLSLFHGEAVAHKLGEILGPWDWATWKDLEDLARMRMDRLAVLEAKERPAALVWTREKPTVDGWYWYSKDGHIVGIEWVSVRSGKASWESPEDTHFYPIEDGFEWCGPIPQPSNPTERAV